MQLARDGICECHMHTRVPRAPVWFIAPQVLNLTLLGDAPGPNFTNATPVTPPDIVELDSVHIEENGADKEAISPSGLAPSITRVRRPSYSRLAAPRARRAPLRAAPHAPADACRRPGVRPCADRRVRARRVRARPELERPIAEAQRPSNGSINGESCRKKEERNE
jgi:hypothetical protein